MKTYPVKFYNESMQGAGNTQDGVAGGMIAILKSCLVDGFGSLPVDNLTWDTEENSAKATFNNGHSYHVDSIITCNGATPVDYNGEHRILKATNNDIWFELDAPPVGDASGEIDIKIAPLGWEISHANANSDIIIFKPKGDIGNVSLRIDNSAYSGWNGSNGYGQLMKADLVEDVVDIDNYKLIATKALPATGRYSNYSWDLVGDSRFFCLLPEYGVAKVQAGYYVGYIDSIKQGDKYHFVLSHLRSSSSASADNYWNQANDAYKCYSFFASNMQFESQIIARKYSQMEGVDSWCKTGLGSRNSDLLQSPNPVDNGFYINDTPPMVLESNRELRGFLPIVINPLSDHIPYRNVNLKNLPEFPNKIFRFLKSTYDNRSSSNETLVGFDISTVEV